MQPQIKQEGPPAPPYHGQRLGSRPPPLNIPCRGYLIPSFPAHKASYEFKTSCASSLSALGLAFFAFGFAAFSGLASLSRAACSEKNICERAVKASKASNSGNHRCFRSQSEQAVYLENGTFRCLRLGGTVGYVLAEGACLARLHKGTQHCVLPLPESLQESKAL